jgi:phosphate:Na+ symporter
MDFFGVLKLVGGLAMFLFGMDIMGSALEKRAGNKLKIILARLTSSPIKGFLLGLVVTAIIQSSSATTVMVVGFVNSGVMKLTQSINIIIGANVGTAVTSWILSLTGIEGSNFILQLFKATSLAAISGFAGMVMYMFSKKQRRKDVGLIFLGFSVLMFGMEIMSDAVEPLADSPEFANILLMFSNPLLGILAGTVFTAIIQSSSASVGILQALSMTGSITFASAVPIIMGQNIGTCVTALLSSTGTSTDARRASMVHLYFNVIGVIAFMIVYYALDALIGFSFVSEAVTPLTIAVIHTVFKIFSTLLFIPFQKQLEKLAIISVREKKMSEEFVLLDERLMITPAIAVDHAQQLTRIMADKAREGVFSAMTLLDNYDEAVDDKVVALENVVDQYEDKIGSYLVKLSAHSLSESDSRQLTELLHLLNDFERISDHSVNIAESAREMHDKQLHLSAEASEETAAVIRAVHDSLDYAVNAFMNNDMDAARKVEPLEETVDTLRDMVKAKHIERLKQGECTIEMGFVLGDLLNDLERVSDHCSNVAMCILEVSQNRFDIHGYQHDFKIKSGFSEEYDKNLDKYTPDDLK